MADDSNPVFEKLNYHPCETPRGTKYYRIDLLNKSEQKQLNELKINTVRKDEKYLAAHPEISAIISLILRNLFTKRSKLQIHDVISNFFDRSIYDIKDDIKIFLKKFRRSHVYENTRELYRSKNLRWQYFAKRGIRDPNTINDCGNDVCICDEDEEFLPYEKYDECETSDNEIWLQQTNTPFLFTYHKENSISIKPLLKDTGKDLKHMSKELSETKLNLPLMEDVSKTIEDLNSKSAKTDFHDSLDNSEKS